MNMQCVVPVLTKPRMSKTARKRLIMENGILLLYLREY